MIPALTLGENHEPAFEMLRSVRDPLMAAFVQNLDPSEEEAILKAIWSFLPLDGLSLSDTSEAFFRNFAGLCERVVRGEVRQFCPVKLRESQFRGYLGQVPDDGMLPEKSVKAAQGFLDFLDAHPEYWPPEFDKYGDPIRRDLPSS